jgi:hypothetical protein
LITWNFHDIYLKFDENHIWITSFSLLMKKWNINSKFIAI